MSVPDAHRIELVASNRTVRVELDGELVGESSRALELHEGSLPVRYYLPAQDVRAELLRPSATHTSCPFKGEASYHSVQTPGGVHEDVVWFYPEPLAAVEPIRDRLCFYGERVELTVDGERV